MNRESAMEKVLRFYYALCRAPAAPPPVLDEKGTKSNMKRKKGSIDFEKVAIRLVVAGLLYCDLFPSKAKL